MISKPGMPAVDNTDLTHLHDPQELAEGASNLNRFDEPSEEREYILSYRHGSAVNQSKTFRFKGSFRQAVERARNHCQLMGYRFIFLKVALSNLDEDEKLRAQGLNI